VFPFERSVARISAEAFVRRVLVGQLHAKACIIGHDFGFGRGRRGNLALLKRLGKALGMGVEAIGAYSYRGTVVSSSVIRRCIQAGAMRKAEQLLGRPYVLYGRVVRGDGRGARMGYPTANVQLQEQVLPPQGVYTVRLHVRGQGFDGVMNLGQRPTFNAGFACEVHCFDKDLQLYRRQVQVEVFRRLRGEKRFASARALVAQIRHDIRRARLLLQ
jgi:riboflavin kinase/FMN adenylyltransferase